MSNNGSLHEEMGRIEHDEYEEENPCEYCGSDRFVTIVAPCVRPITATFTVDTICPVEGAREEHYYEGLVPAVLHIAGSSDRRGKIYFSEELEFSYCLDCGKMDGDFPITEASIQKELNGRRKRMKLDGFIPR
jgi:hypothetical protein